MKCVKDWISVKERMPFEEYKNEKIGVVGDFIVHIKPDDEEDDATVTVYEYSTKRGWCYFGGTPSPYSKNVTDWMPLPDPPNKDSM